MSQEHSESGGIHTTGKDTDEMQRRFILDHNTLIPIGATLAFLAGALWIRDGIAESKAEVMILQHKVELLEQRLNIRLDDLEANTDERFRAWVRELKASNPTLIVPPTER